MATTTHDVRVHPDALELAELLRPAWAEIDAGLILSGVPLCEGDADDDTDADAAPAGDDDQGDQGDDDGAAGAGNEPDWKAQSRKHEREAKRARKERDEAARKLKEREDADKTDQQKAVEEARRQAREEALSESEKERRSDRLEVSVTRLAAKGITIGEGDDAETVRFADPEDALIHIQRAIDKGDLDADDIFNSEGKVQTDALQTALTDLIERKPHLRAGHNADGAPAPRVKGDADAGKGAGKSLDNLSIDDHLKHVQNK